MDAWAAALAGSVADIAGHLGRDPGLLNRPLRDGQTLIFAAISHQHAALLQFLLDAGADPNIADDHTCSPLYTLVARARLTSAFRVSHIVSLAEAGAHLDKGREATGDTPLMVCARNHGEAEIDALLCWGANIMARDHFGDTALDEARRVSATNAISLLTRRPQKLP